MDIFGNKFMPKGKSFEIVDHLGINRIARLYQSGGDDTILSIKIGSFWQKTRRLKIFQDYVPDHALKKIKLLNNPFY